MLRIASTWYIVSNLADTGENTGHEMGLHIESSIAHDLAEVWLRRVYYRADTGIPTTVLSRLVSKYLSLLFCKNLNYIRTWGQKCPKFKNIQMACSIDSIPE